jgi:hypothetical protein
VKTISAHTKARILFFGPPGNFVTIEVCYAQGAAVAVPVRNHRLYHRDSLHVAPHSALLLLIAVFKCRLLYENNKNGADFHYILENLERMFAKNACKLSHQREICTIFSHRN